MQTRDSVIDQVDDFGLGEIIDVYVNYHGDNPVTVYVVDFGDDKVFDRYEHEIKIP